MLIEVKQNLFFPGAPQEPFESSVFVETGSATISVVQYNGEPMLWLKRNLLVLGVQCSVLLSSRFCLGRFSSLVLEVAETTQ